MNVRFNAKRKKNKNKKAQISNPGFTSNKSFRVLMPHQYHGNNIYSDLAFPKALPHLCSSHHLCEYHAIILVSLPFSWCVKRIK